MQTLLETIQALDATRLSHLSDLHVVADGRRATVYLCFAPPGSYLPTLVGEVLPVGLDEQLQALAASGLVGHLQVTVLPWADTDREAHLLAKTHAGSTTERTAWRQTPHLGSRLVGVASRLNAGQAAAPTARTPWRDW